MVVDAPEHILEPSTGIAIVEAGGLDQGVDGGGALATAIKLHNIPHTDLSS